MRHITICAAALAALSSTPALAATNILPTATVTIAATGLIGHLRNDDWLGTASLAPLSSIIDGVFLPEGTVWNAGTVYWDQDDSVNEEPVSITFTLDQDYTFHRFVLQADNNDTYRIQYWTGVSWSNVWTASVVANHPGLQTRTSDELDSITTSRLRITGGTGDNYFSVSEFQGFGVAAAPEPGAWALMILGFGGAGAALRRRRRGMPLTAR